MFTHDDQILPDFSPPVARTTPDGLPPPPHTQPCSVSLPLPPEKRPESLFRPRRTRARLGRQDVEGTEGGSDKADLGYQTSIV